jgi:hypothetical protein
MGVSTVMGLTMGVPERLRRIRSLLTDIPICEVTIFPEFAPVPFPMMR